MKEWAVGNACWVKVQRNMADETHIFLFRFGLCIGILLILSIGWCYLQNYFTRRPKKGLVCTCGLGQGPLPPSIRRQLSDGNVCEMVAVPQSAMMIPEAAPLYTAPPALKPLIVDRSSAF